MLRCAVKPYEGKDSYIFVSYAHRDKKEIYPIIENMEQNGYRIWYDEGIEPGSEWTEYIASHLDACSAFIAFISKNAIDSHNCRREINYALKKGKPFISVFVEEVELSPGMDMQLSANQAIYKYYYPKEDAFYGKLFETNFLNDCRNTAEAPVEDVSDSDDEKADENEIKNTDGNKKEEKKKKGKYAFPGFRSKKTKNIVLATIYYVLISLFLLFMCVFGGDYGSRSYFFAVDFFVLFVPVFIFADYLGWADNFKLSKKRTPKITCLIAGIVYEIMIIVIISIVGSHML